MKMHDIIDNLFVHLENTGSISDSNLVRMMTLSLIDDYRYEIALCNKDWTRILDDIERSIMNTSCLFRIDSNC